MCETTYPCWNCGDENAPHEIEENHYCDDCHSEFTVCEGCQDTERLDACLYSTIEETHYCESCFDNRFTFCATCNEQVKHNDCTNDLCQVCYDEQYVCCESCGNDILIDASYSNDSGNCYCSECYNDLYTHCEGCNDEIYRDNSLYHESSDCSFCEDCYPGNSFDDIKQDMNWAGKDEYTDIKSKRKFGVELETSEFGDSVDWVENLGWGAVEDGSISGAEFVSPPLYGDDGLKSIREVCNNFTNCVVDTHCGYHLHVDLSDTNASDRKSIDYAYHLSKPVWAKFVADRRIRGTYSDFDLVDIADVVNATDYTAGGGRYGWINWHSFNRYGTLEIRAHEGTTDYDGITNWVKAHTRFVDYVKNFHCDRLEELFSNIDKTLYTLLNIWKDDSLYNFYMDKGDFPRRTYRDNQQLLFST